MYLGITLLFFLHLVNWRAEDLSGEQIMVVQNVLIHVIFRAINYLLIGIGVMKLNSCTSDSSSLLRFSFLL